MREEPIQITDIDFADIGEETAEGAAKSLELIAELHRRQAELYAGGPAGPVADLLADDIVWHVVGESPIAGVYRGWDAVLQCLSSAREMSRESLRIHPGEVVGAGRVREAWLVPLELAWFDRIWPRWIGRWFGAPAFGVGRWDESQSFACRSPVTSRYRPHGVRG